MEIPGNESEATGVNWLLKKCFENKGMSKEGLLTGDVIAIT